MTYTSDDNFLDDARLQIDDNEVTITVETDVDTTEVYVASTADYADSLAKQQEKE